MAYSLGGRAAEHLVSAKYRQVLSATSKRLRNRLYANGGILRMSEKIGNISFYDSTGQMDFNFTKHTAKEQPNLSTMEVKEIVEESYQRACISSKNTWMVW
jgi:cell division protease FtsH